LLALQQRLSKERLARRVGERVTVMVDAEAGRGQWAGRLAGSAWEVDGAVVIEGENLEPGRLVRARITGAAAYDVFARVERDEPKLLPILRGNP
jgi:ribosomal protein S12 methylthiotransferase